MDKENEKLEYKKTTSELKEAVNSISAMLNKHGSGEIYFGVRDDGTPLGLTITEKTMRDISQTVFNHLTPKISPTISEVIIEDKKCIKVSFSGNEVPYFAYGRAFIRVADENRLMSPAELESFYRKKIEKHYIWDSEPSDMTPDKIVTEVLKKYIQSANQVDRINFTFTNKINVLGKLDLLIEGKLKNAAMVYFCGMPFTKIQMAVFASKEKRTFNDIARGSGSVPELIALGENYIKNVIHWRVVFGNSMQREEIPEIPIIALREALMNSFCHRDYTSTQYNEIAIYSNRIEIYNPGTFPEGCSPEDFFTGEKSSIKRNPTLADLMYYVKDIENFGTGLKKISEACTDAGVKVGFRTSNLGFTIIFYRPELYPNREEEQNISIDSNEDPRIASIIEFCREPRTRKEIQEFIGIIDKGYFRRTLLNPLLDSGKLRRTNPDNPNDKRQKYFST